VQKLMPKKKLHMEIERILVRLLVGPEKKAYILTSKILADCMQCISGFLEIICRQTWQI
jgi:hypothetical protein